MLRLHLIELRAELQVLGDLRRVLLIDARQVSHDLAVLVLHLLDFGAPLRALLVLLLAQQVALLLDAHLLELEHLNLIIDVLALHGAQLDLILDVIHLLRSRYYSRCFPLLLLVMSVLVATLVAVFVDVHLLIVILVTRLTFDLLVVSKLLSGRRVPFALTLNATIVRTCICPTERLILCGLLIFFASHICCVLIEIIVVEKRMIRSFLNGLLFLIALPRSLINLPTRQLARGTTAKVLLDPANDLTIVVGCGTAGGICTATRWWFVSGLHLL